jgi:hypothetical protein
MSEYSALRIAQQAMHSVARAHNYQHVTHRSSPDFPASRFRARERFKVALQSECLRSNRLLRGPIPWWIKWDRTFASANRFLRLWLCTQKILIQELIPQLREEAHYRASITRVCPQLPFDSGLDG